MVILKATSELGGNDTEGPGTGAGRAPQAVYAIMVDGVSAASSKKASDVLWSRQQHELGPALYAATWRGRAMPVAAGLYRENSMSAEPMVGPAQTDEHCVDIHVIDDKSSSGCSSSTGNEVDRPLLPLPGIFEDGERVEYFSAGFGAGEWLLADVAVSTDSYFRNGDARRPQAVYDIKLLGTGQFVQSVHPEQLRRPFEEHEPCEFFMLRTMSWVEAVVWGQQDAAATEVGYRVAVLAEDLDLLSKVPPCRLRRRFPPGSLVDVYWGPEAGWIRAEVLYSHSESGHSMLPTPTKANRHIAMETIWWMWVTIRAEGWMKEECVQSYRLRLAAEWLEQHGRAFLGQDAAAKLPVRQAPVPPPTEEVFKMYQDGISIEYHCPKLGQWFSGSLKTEVVDTDGRCRVLYSVRFLGSDQWHRNVAEELLRHPLMGRELVEVYLPSEDDWVPGVVQGPPHLVLGTAHAPVYSVHLTGEGSELLECVPACRVRRWFPPGSAVQVYWSTRHGWVNAEVLSPHAKDVPYPVGTAKFIGPAGFVWVPISLGGTPAILVGSHRLRWPHNVCPPAPCRATEYDPLENLFHSARDARQLLAQRGPARYASGAKTVHAVIGDVSVLKAGDNVYEFSI